MAIPDCFPNMASPMPPRRHGVNIMSAAISGSIFSAFINLVISEVTEGPRWQEAEKTTSKRALRAQANSCDMRAASITCWNLRQSACYCSDRT